MYMNRYRDGLERFGHHHFVLNYKTMERWHDPNCCPLCVDFLNRK